MSSVSSRAALRRLHVTVIAIGLTLGAIAAGPAYAQSPSEPAAPASEAPAYTGPVPTIAGQTATPYTGQCVNTTTTPPPAADLVAAAQDRAMISYNAPSVWSGPTSAPAPVGGKKIAIVSVAQLTEGSARAARGMEEAAKAMGWEPTILDGKGQPDVILQAVNSAVDSAYDGILLIFINPDSVSEPLNRAKEAGIPVVTLGVAPYTQTRNEQWGWIPDVSHDWVYTGEVIGDYMIWKSGGNVNALLLNGAETMIVDCGQFKGTYERLLAHNACPNCHVAVDTFTIAQLETQPAEKAIAAVQADPNLGWVWCYDFCMANVAKQMIAAGVQGEVKGAGFDCNAENIQLIKDGKVQVVCIADPRDWEAWAAVDNLNRVMQGQPAVDQAIPVRLFDKDNANEFTETDAAAGWQGGFDYKTQYKTIWGVQ